MRFFLCPFGDYHLGIPTEAVASLLVNSRKVSGMVEWDDETGDVYFSLPRFFGFSNLELRHGIVIKDPDNFGDRNRKILLVTTVEKIEDIMLEEIQKLPGILRNIETSAYFTGMCFNRSVPVILVDPTHFLQRILNYGIVSALEEVGYHD
jgi:chemotaxis signal transduction protein